MLTRLIQQLRGEPLHHRAKNTTQSSLSEAERSQKEVRVEATMKTKQMEGGRQVERERERQHWGKSETLKTTTAPFGQKILANIAIVIPAAINKGLITHIADLKNNKKA